MAKTVRILYDSAPLSGELATLNDYGAMVIYSPMAAPLMSYSPDGQLTPSPVCRAYQGEHNGMIHRFLLEPGWKRADGSPVTAKDYVDAIHRILEVESQATLLLRHLRNYDDVRAGQAPRNTLGVHAEGPDLLTLVIETVQPDFIIPKVLASCRFSPQVSIDQPERAAGPFYLVQQKKDRFRFALNPGYPRPPSAKAVSLQFKHCRTPMDNYRNYLLGKTDITCNTAFPYEKVSADRGRPDFIACANHLIMGLVFIPTDEDPQEGRKLRQALNHLIDRRKIAKQLHQAVTPASDFRPHFATPFTCMGDPLFNPEFGCAKIRTVRHMRQDEEISISCGFDDFYPNKQVIEAIRHQLAEYRIHLIPVEDSFESSVHHNYQMKLMILFPEILDDIGLYSIIPFATPLLLEPGPRESYLRLLDAYTAADSEVERLRHLSQLEQLALGGAYIVPLFKLNDLYFKAPGIEGVRFNPFPDYTQVHVEKR